MSDSNPKPSRGPWYLRLLLALSCPWHLREEIAGDMEELHHRRVARFGTQAARRMYLRDLRSLVRLARAGEGNRTDQFDFLIHESKKRGGMMSAFGQDMRQALRLLAKSPMFTLVTVLTLALGIGANTAIFSVVDAVLLRPLPFHEPERLVQVWNQLANEGLPRLWLSEPEFLFYREHQRIFDGFAVYANSGGNLTTGGEPMRVSIINVSDGFFSTLGIQPLLGRSFTAEEDTPGNDRVLLLEHSFWKNRFGGDPGIVNKEVVLNSRTYTVVGVMPPGFSFPLGGVDMWTPMAIDTAKPRSRGSHFMEAIARMKPGFTVKSASEEMNRLALELGGYENGGWGAYVLPFRDSFVGDNQIALLVLLGAVGFVLLIACANVANLMLARAASREKEIAIRFALGSSRWRVTRQLLVESLLLSLVGAGLGVLLANWAIPPLVALASDQIPSELAIGVDGRVLGFTLAVALLTGVFFGLAPALHTSRKDLHEVLSEGGRSSATGLRRRFRQALVVSEVAIALVLLIGGGLMLRSFAQLLNVDPGYTTENLITFRLSLPSSRYPAPQDRVNFFSNTIQRIEDLPGVAAAGAVSLLPLSNLHNSGSTFIRGKAPSRPDDDVGFFEADQRFATPGYFDALRLRLIQGRWFSAADGPEAPPVVVVDETFAKTAWPGMDPLGREVSVNRDDKMNRVWRTVVGVVAHVKHYGLSTEGREQIYFPQEQAGAGSMFITVRGVSNPAQLMNAIRAQVAQLDPELPLFNVRTMKERLNASVGLEELIVLLVGGFGVVAMVLAAVGIYGVMSYSVSQRTREIGVRMALGAGPNKILGMVLRNGMVLTVLGVTIGLTAGLGLTRFMQTLLFGVSATDPLTFLAGPVTLTAVAALACWVPARRAARTDPMIALRHE